MSLASLRVRPQPQGSAELQLHTRRMVRAHTVVSAAVAVGTSPDEAMLREATNTMPFFAGRKGPSAEARRSLVVLRCEPSVCVRR